MLCKICSSETVPFARGRVLKRHEISYFSCPSCGFLQTEEPFWLSEAYQEAIALADVGLVQRNLRRAVILKALIPTLFRADGKFLDYGGGYGMLVRLMRDAGFDFRRFDRHCANLLARGFEAEPGAQGGYELVTAMELFEHFVDPLAEIEEMLRYSRSIFFTTLLLPEPAPRPGEWWYYAPDQGQHVSFYTRRSLEAVAARFGLNLITDGVSRHLLTERRVSPLLFKALSKYKTGLLLAPLMRRKSLLPEDYRAVTGSSFAGGDQ